LKDFNEKRFQCHVEIEAKEELCDILYIGEDKLIVTASENAMQFWNISDGACVSSIEHNSIQLVLLQDHKLVSISSITPCFRIYDLKNFEHKLYDVAKTREIIAMTQLENGRLVISIDSPSALPLVDTQYDLLVWQLNGLDAHEFRRIENAHLGMVFCLQPLPGSFFASGCEDQSIRIWNNDYRAVHTLEGHVNTVYALQLLPNGLLASGSSDRTLRIWDWRIGECLRVVEESGAVKSFWHISNSHLAFRVGNYGEPYSLVLYDIKSGEKFKKISGAVFADNDKGVFILTALGNNLYASIHSNKLRIFDFQNNVEKL
jgi:WD40 repeat protein